MKISTFVFLDLEATGLAGPGDRPHITEISMVAVHRDILLNDIPVCLPRVVDKLTICVQPRKPIPFMVSQKTGLFNDSLSKQKDFDESLATILNLFLQRHETPVCLVAHNGYAYDFGLLQVELASIGCSLPEGILCVDSLQLFRSLDNVENDPRTMQLNTPTPRCKTKSLNQDRTESQCVTNAAQKHTHSQKADLSSAGDGSNELPSQPSSVIMVKRKLFPDDVAIEEKPVEQGQLMAKKMCLKTQNNVSTVNRDAVAPESADEYVNEISDACEGTQPFSLSNTNRNASRSCLESTDSSNCEKAAILSPCTTSMTGVEPTIPEDNTRGNTISTKSDPTSSLDSQQTIPYWEDEFAGYSNTNSLHCPDKGSDQTSSLQREDTQISDSVLAGLDLSGVSTIVSQASLQNVPKQIVDETLVKKSVMEEKSNGLALDIIRQEESDQQGPHASTHTFVKPAQEKDLTPDKLDGEKNVDTITPSTTKATVNSENKPITVADTHSNLACIGLETKSASLGTPSTTTNSALYRTPDRDVSPRGSGKPNTGYNSKVFSGGKISYRLEEIHRRVVGCYPTASHRAEDDALALVRIFQVSGSKAINWADQHAVPIADVSPIYTARPRKTLPDGQFVF